MGFLCSRNARRNRKGEATGLSCLRNAHDIKVLVRRGQRRKDSTAISQVKKLSPFIPGTRKFLPGLRDTLLKKGLKMTSQGEHLHAGYNV